MKVAHVITGLGVGGAEQSLYKLLVEFSSDTSVHHYVICLSDRGELDAKFLALGNTEVISLHLRWYSVFFKFIGLINLIGKINPNCVQTWMYHSDLFGGLAAKIAGINNIIWSVRSFDEGAGGFRPILCIRKLCAWLSSTIPKAVVYQGPSTQKFHELIGYDGRKSVVIPNGYKVELNDVACIRKVCSRRVILSVGRLDPLKDHETAVKVAVALLSRRKDVDFWFVGRGVDASAPLFSDLRVFGERVQFFGEISDVSVLLRVVDVFFMHSISEGFPNVLAEAMICGLPCVTTDTGEAASLLGDSRFTVPIRDTIKMIAVLGYLLDVPPDKLQSIGLSNHTRMYDRYQLSKQLSRFYQLYISGPSSPRC